MQCLRPHDGRMGNRRRVLWQFWLVMGILVILLVFAVVSLFLKMGKIQHKSYYPSLIGSLPVVTDLLPEDALNRPGILREIEWIVIHETGNPAAGADAAAHNTYIHSIAKTTELSWHYTVDEKGAYHHLPDNEVGWHAGDRLTEDGGNKNGIGIEICVNEDGKFVEALENAQLLTGYLLFRYGLGQDAVKQHGDFIGKNCPEHIRDEGLMEEFVENAVRYRDAFLSGELEAVDLFS